jgi:hypothetical protein
MPSAAFPTWAECLEEFAAGMREVQEVAADGALPISPLLRKPPVSYADFMAGREQKDA